MYIVCVQILYTNLYKRLERLQILGIFRASLVDQRLKRLPPMQEIWVQSLGREDPLEKEMATHSSILAWRIPWTEEPSSPQGRKESDMTERLHSLTHSLSPVQLAL